MLFLLEFLLLEAQTLCTSPASLLYIPFATADCIFDDPKLIDTLKEFVFNYYCAYTIKIL